MKISDIINQKNNKPRIDEEQLQKQRQEIIEETTSQQPMQDMQQQPIPNMQHQNTGFFIPNQERQRNPEDQQRITEPGEAPNDPRYNSPEYQSQGTPYLKPKKLKLKFTVFLDNGQKLPITFECPEDKVEEVIGVIDNKIQLGELITIGDFKFLGSKVLYIDMLGR